MSRLPDALKQRGVHQLLRTTLQGHKRPDLAIDEASFLIHTRTCTYALDDEGICREVIAVGEQLPRGVDRCRGAQYVASLDKDSDDGLCAEPRPGARALFVGRGTGTRVALLKTGVITRVEEIAPVKKRRARVRPRAGFDVRSLETLASLQSTPPPAKATRMMLPRVNAAVPRVNAAVPRP